MYSMYHNATPTALSRSDAPNYRDEDVDLNSQICRF